MTSRAPVEDLIVGLAQKFRDAGRRFHQQQQTATRVGRFRLGHDPVQFARTTDEVLLDHAAETRRKFSLGLRLLITRFPATDYTVNLRSLFCVICRLTSLSP